MSDGAHFLSFLSIYFNFSLIRMPYRKVKDNISEEGINLRKSLVLALMLVLALGSMVLAAPPDNFRALPNHLGKTHSIPIGLYVEKFAHIGNLEDSPFEFALDAPSSTGDTDERQTKVIEFAANTGVYVELEEDITLQMWRNLPDPDDPSIGLPIHVHIALKNRDNQRVGGSVSAFASNNKGQRGAWARYSFDSGRYTEEIVLGYGWNAFPYSPPASNRSWDEYAWWLIKDGHYNGHLTITITAH
ncbi:MAG TPA: hypothetical protein GXX47_04915 [Firmicutes bacterium]|nr:hypothetical protein [Bacillota bacterium]